MSVRWSQTLRTALSALLAALAGFAFHVDDPFWAIITVFALSAAYVEVSVLRAIYRAGGTLVGASLALVMASLTANSRYLYLTQMFVVTVVGVYLALTRKTTYPYMFGLLAYDMVTVIAIQDPGAAFHTAFWRNAEVLQGMIVLTLVGFFFFRRSAFDQAKKELVRLTAQEAVLLRLVFGIAIGQNNDEAIRATLKQMSTIRRSLSRAIEIVRSSRHYKGVTSFVLTQMLVQHREIDGELERLWLSLTDAATLTPAAETSLRLEPLIEKMTGLLSRLHSSPEDSLLESTRINRERMQLENRLQAAPRDNAEVRTAHLIAISLTALAHALRAIALAQQVRALETDEQREFGVRRGQIERELTTVPHSIALKRGVRVGVSVLVALNIWFASNWYGAVPGIVSALLIGLERDIYFTWRKAFQRLLGNTLGAVAGIILLSVFVDDVVSFAIAFFPAALLVSYVLAGSPARSYIGFQAGIGLSIAMVTSDRLSSSISLPLQRVAGVLLGSAVITVVSALLWPQAPRRGLDTGFASCFRYMSRLLRGVSSQSWSQHDQFAMLRAHNSNTDLLDSLKDDARSAIWALESQAMLHVLCLLRRDRFRRATVLISDRLDLTKESETLSALYEQMADIIDSNTACNLDVPAVKEGVKNLQTQLAEFERTDLFYQAPAEEIGALLTSVGALIELYKISAQFQPAWDRLALAANESRLSPVAAS